MTRELTALGWIPYVQSAASQEVPPPYNFPGVTVHAFVCETALPKVQAYCDKFFNLGDPQTRGFRYDALGAWPYGLMMFIDYPVMIRSGRGPENIGGETPYSDRGIVSQQEVFITVPVMRVGTAPGTLLTHSAIEWAIPFITVGNPMSAVCGREMVGLQKLRGDITFGEGHFPESFSGRVRLPGWVATAGQSLQQMHPFLRVDTGPVTPTFRGSPRESSMWTLLRSRAASGGIAGLATLSNFVDTITAGAVPTTMDTVSLKQLRDAQHPDKAIYQALVACRTKYTNIDRVRFFKEDDVRITFENTLGSFKNVAPYLQTSSQQPLDRREANKIQPVAAYRFNADIDFDDMRTLHEYPIYDCDAATPSSLAVGDLSAPWLRPWKGFFGPRQVP